MRVLAIPVFLARSLFPAQKSSLFSVNALAVIGQEPSIHARLRDPGLQRNDTCRMVVPNRGTGDELAQGFTK